MIRVIIELLIGGLVAGVIMWGLASEEWWRGMIGVAILCIVLGLDIAQYEIVQDYFKYRKFIYRQLNVTTSPSEGYRTLVIHSPSDSQIVYVPDSLYDNVRQYIKILDYKEEKE